LIAGTPVQGYAKRELSDGWVPTQLWIINHVGTNIYTIENANSRTFLDLGMLFSEPYSRLLLMKLVQAANPNGTSVLGRPATGSDHQKWVISRNTNGTAYVYVKTL
jgi:hypothetical protein